MPHALKAKTFDAITVTWQFAMHAAHKGDLDHRLFCCHD